MYVFCADACMPSTEVSACVVCRVSSVLFNGLRVLHVQILECVMCRFWGGSFVVCSDELRRFAQRKLASLDSARYASSGLL